MSNVYSHIIVKQACISFIFRSSVTGTYRIVLHRIQKRNTLDALNANGQGTNGNGQAKEPLEPTNNKKQSKFCTIL